jgi:hypothetical protein
MQNFRAIKLKPGSEFEPKGSENVEISHGGGWAASYMLISVSKHIPLICDESVTTQNLAFLSY